MIIIIGKGASYLQLRKGDLVVLDAENCGENALKGPWCTGRNERTGERGDFPSNAIRILATLTKPPSEVMVNLFISFLDLCICLADFSIFPA